MAPTKLGRPCFATITRSRSSRFFDRTAATAAAKATPTISAFDLIWQSMRLASLLLGGLLADTLGIRAV
jgi:hypothetical protein